MTPATYMAIIWYTNYAVFPIKNNYCPRGVITSMRFLVLDMLLFHVKQRICDARRKHHAVFF
jgi:hypothetical protein